MSVSDNVFKKTPFYIGILLLILFCIGAIGTAVLHSSYFQKRIFDSLASSLKESGWTLSSDQIQGSVFEEIRLKNVQLHSLEGDEIRIGSLKTSLSLLRLVKRQIAFQNLEADQISWTQAKSSCAKDAAPPLQGIPFSLLFSNFTLTHVQLPQEGPLLNLRGTLSVGRFNRRAKLHIDIEKENTVATLALRVRSNKKAELQCNYATESMKKDLSPWLSFEGDAKANLHLVAKGAWEDVLAYLCNRPGEKSIQGILRGTMTIENVPTLSLLVNRRWTLFSQLDLSPLGDLSLSKIAVRGGSVFFTQGACQLSRSFDLKASNLDLYLSGLKDVEIAPIEGPLEAKLELQNNTLNVSATAKNLSWERLSLQNTTANLHLTKENGVFTGPLHANTTMQQEAVDATCLVAIDSTKQILFDHIQLDSSLLSGQGAITIDSDQTAIGALFIQIPNLHQIDPELPFYGKGELSLRWSPPDSFTQLEIDAIGENLYLGDFYAKSAFVYADFAAGENLIYAELQNGSYEIMQTQTLSLEMTSEDRKSWDTTLKGDGDWKGPFLFHSNGRLSYEQQTLSAQLEALDGTLFFQPLSLAMPAQIEMGPNLFRLNHFDLLIGCASLQAQMEHRGDFVSSTLQLNCVPLDFLSLNPLDISVAGIIRLDAKYEQNGKKTTGTLNAELVDIEIGTLGDQDPIEGYTSIQAALSNNRLSLKGAMRVRQEELLNLTLDVPLHVRLFPNECKLLDTKEAKGTFSYRGRVEEILDFFDIGAQRIEGQATCDLTLRGTLNRPLLEGYCHIDDGFYENYVTGFELKRLHAEILAEKSSLYLRSLSAKDNQNKGTLSMTGELSLRAKERFPFHFDGSFSRLNTTDLAWMKLETGGSFQIRGDTSSARISGQAIVLEGDVTIPERLPPSLPNLDVRYINLSKPLKEELTTVKKPIYPIFFDYRILAPEGVYISGKGLESEWKGDFQIGGTVAEIEAKGALNLINGSFTFSGRSFDLTEGALTFTGKPNEMPVLNLAANMHLQNLILIAKLKGFLNAPQLTFQSKPPLPMGSILSYLLFGRDLSDIGAIQAAQIVASLSALSGSGSDVLGGARRSIGVDRLRIIADPVSESGAQTYSLQVGKYVTRGVLVSISQGTEKDTTNLSAEVDLPHGFVIEAESMQKQQQGKFTLKWNYNY